MPTFTVAYSGGTLNLARRVERCAARRGARSVGGWFGVAAKGLISAIKGTVPLRAILSSTLSIR
jgi:hypothetical protein